MHMRSWMRLLCSLLLAACGQSYSPVAAHRHRSLRALSPPLRRCHAPHCSALPPPPLAVRIGEGLNQLYERSRGIKCPFFRRRAGDAVNSLWTIAEFLAARHKSLGGDLLPARFKPANATPKQRGLPLEAVMDAVRADFEQGQYYVSGRLTRSIYDDACFFDGPDPDMPVRSLQRYGDALRGLFDPALSHIELLRLERVSDAAFVAHWRLSGALKLPWRPAIKPYSGATLYEVGDDGLIASHTETWSISALDAFASTVLPGFGEGAAPVDQPAYVTPPEPRITAQAR